MCVLDVNMCVLLTKMTKPPWVNSVSKLKGSLLLILFISHFSHKADSMVLKNTWKIDF